MERPGEAVRAATGFSIGGVPPLGHPMWNHCERTTNGWVYTSDHN